MEFVCDLRFKILQEMAVLLNEDPTLCEETLNAYLRGWQEASKTMGFFVICEVLLSKLWQSYSFPIL